MCVWRGGGGGGGRVLHEGHSFLNFILKCFIKGMCRHFKSWFENTVVYNLTSKCSKHLYFVTCDST